jgi:hypothetical protein
LLNTESPAKPDHGGDNDGTISLVPLFSFASAGQQAIEDEQYQTALRELRDW